MEDAGVYRRWCNNGNERGNDQRRSEQRGRKNREEIARRLGGTLRPRSPTASSLDVLCARV